MQNSTAQKISVLESLDESNIRSFNSDKNNLLIDNNNSSYNANNSLDDKTRNTMASMSISTSSSTTTSSPILENYLLDLKKVIEWLVASETQLSNQSEIGNDVNSVKQQFQTHEVKQFIL